MTAVNLWEFCVFFCSYFLCNRLFMWCLHRSCEGGDQEMWRGSQQWVWLAPNHVKAIYKVRTSLLGFTSIGEHCRGCTAGSCASTGGAPPIVAACLHGSGVWCTASGRLQVSGSSGALISAVG